MAPRKPFEKKEGGIVLKSDSTRISGSEIAGRDIKKYVTGLSGEDVAQIIEAMSKHFSEAYLKNPKELDKTLTEFQHYHEQLHEYKELHNGVNDILVAFEQFRGEIDRSNSRRSLPKLERLRDLWRPVSINVESLLIWAKEIKHITELSWIHQFDTLKRQINNHLGLDDLLTEKIDYPNRLRIFVFQTMDIEIPWWNTLSELTSSFNHISAEHMNSADKQLRNTAEKLYNLSNKVFPS